MSQAKVPKPRILLVDDEETFRNALKHVLLKAGYDTMAVVGGNEAKLALQEMSFDVIISDISMPDGDGIHLMEHVAKTSSTPVILMTGIKSLIETKQGFEAGARRFLVKPFLSKDILKAVEECLNNDSIKEDDHRDYCSLPIDYFIFGKEIRYDIYIRLAPTNFFKIAQGGANLRSEQIQAYRSKGIDKLWLTKKDFKDYLKFSIRLGKTLKHSDIPDSRKLIFFQRTSKLLLATAGTAQVDKDFLHQGMGIVESVVAILTETSDFSDLIEFMMNEDDTLLYGHSLGVALYVSLMALRLGWSSPDTLFHLGAGGLFHDIGLKEIPPAVLAKSRLQQSSAERALYETHPLRGADILKKIPRIPDEVVLIVQQHHENEIGCGYPARLKRNRIYPLAKMVAVADEFCESMQTEDNIDQASVAKVLLQLSKSHAGALELGMVGALMAVFNVDMPKEVLNAFTSHTLGKKQAA